MKTSPFISSRPVRGNEFVNREKEISIILGRAFNGESTIVVGGPKTGKTSLLLELINIGNESEDSQAESPTFKFIYFDASLANSPEDIWKMLWRSTLSKTIRETEKISRLALERELEVLADQNTILCLVVDDFDRLFLNPNFQDPVFFTALRSLTTRTGALVNIFSSQLRADELNNAGSTLLNIGSPFFNHMIEVELETFSKDSFEKILQKSDADFSEDKRKIIHELAGHNVYLFQAVASSIYMMNGGRLAEIPERIFMEVSYFFDSLWETLNDDAKNLLVKLGLSQINEITHKTPVAFPEFRSSQAELTLKKLIKMGLIDNIQDTENGNFLRLSSLLHVWWLRDILLSDSHKIPEFDAVLKSKLHIEETGTINSFITSALNRV